MRVLFFGDVYGKNGMKALEKYLDKIKSEYKPHLIVLNGENVDDGFSISEKQYKTLMGMGVHAITMGNHTFRKKEIMEFIDDSNIIRPANYPKGAPGVGYKTIQFNDKKVTIVNLLGRIFMGDTLNNPFEVIDEILEAIDSDYVFVDFHAEATSEKLGFAHYVDGRVTGVVGTHTHVPTADNIVLPKGTMYISDIGMTGPLYGILGADRDVILYKFTTGLPSRIKEEQSRELQVNAVVMDTDLNTIKRINIYEK
jgi:metallophosphoesterase (TIGR00282 family)